MQRFIHTENIARYRRLIALGETNPGRDEARHQMLIRLLAEEEAKDRAADSALPDV
jgi:ferritin-like metal-binding protein YciE